MDLGEIHARIKPGFDPTLREPRAERPPRIVAAHIRPHAYARIHAFR
jgi:hypothetical protein